jgi:hypothetical protein
MEDDGIAALASSKTLKELCILGSSEQKIPVGVFGNHFESYFGKKGLDALLENQILTSLGIEYVEMDNRMLETLASNPILTSLCINNSNIRNEGAKILAKSRNFTRLDVRNNRIGDEGAIALAGNKALTSLDISGNNLGQKGIEALIENSALTYLGISYNQIKNIGRAISEKAWNRREEIAKLYSQLGDLLFLIFSGKDLEGGYLPKLPSELEKLILGYCKPPPFTFRNWGARF